MIGFQKIRRLIKQAAFCVAIGGLAIGCARSTEPESRYHLVFGGDVFLGRGLNEALFDATGGRELFGDSAPLFRNADVALINGEGVIAQGGYLFNKGEPRPFMFRAHPKVIDVLKDAGIDVVTVGNNHSCDYGPQALREMLHRLRKANIDYTGGGLSIGDARTASFHRVGDLSVAIVGVDLTNAQACAATGNRPGVLFYDVMSPKAAEARVVEGLGGVLKEARRFADLVFLTPHWGDNGIDVPTEATRRLAAKLIRAGFDGIFGHSAHRFQGVELVDGKPVIYDAGNLIDDMGGARGMVWDVTFSRTGVQELTGHPVRMVRNHTMLASGPEGARMVRVLQDRSKPYGTAVVDQEGTAKIACRSIGGGSQRTGDPPKRPVPNQILVASNDFVRDKIPADATPVRVVYPNGLSIVGFKLFADKLFVPKAAQVVELYFQTDRPLRESLRVEFLAAVRGGQAKNLDRHIPGDWLFPANLWPVGKIITDRKLFRLNFAPAGTVAFSAAIVDGAPLVPVESSLPIEDGTHVVLGDASYQEGTPRIYQYINEVTAARP